MPKFLATLGLSVLVPPCLRVAFAVRRRWRSWPLNESLASLTNDAIDRLPD